MIMMVMTNNNYWNTEYTVVLNAHGRLIKGELLNLTEGINNYLKIRYSTLMGK